MRQAPKFLQALLLLGAAAATLVPLTGAWAQAQQVTTRQIQTPYPYNACNLRAGPGVGYTTIGTFYDGTQVTLTGERVSGWYSVQVGSSVGWMARQCLGL